MKLMFASDLHGSLPAGEQVMARFEIEKPEKLVLLGDLLYHGARNDLPEGYSTKGLTALLNRYKEHIIAVRGNCDSEIDQVVLEFPMMSDYCVIYADGRIFLITHGHVFSEDCMIPHTPGTVLIHGHTHVKVMEKHGDFYYLNPGSAALPKDDSIGSYMIYEDGCFTIRDLKDGSVLREMKL